MEFSPQKPIFLQICDFLIDKILLGEFSTGARVPSVRDLAGTLSVNPNTVQRAYAELQTKELFEQQRGVGYFITQQAKEVAIHLRRDEFVQIQFPLLLHQMETLKITWQDLQDLQQQCKEKPASRWTD